MGLVCPWGRERSRLHLLVFKQRPARQIQGLLHGEVEAAADSASRSSVPEFPGFRPVANLALAALIHVMLPEYYDRACQ